MTAADVFFMALFLVIYTFSAYLVIRSFPCETDSPRWIRAAAWVIYAALAVILPNLFGDDVITMVTLCVYYLVIGRVLYHRSKTGLLYQLIYCLVNYAAQVIGVMIGVKLLYNTALEQSIVSYMMMTFKSALVLAAAIVIAGVLRKRYAKDNKSLKIRGMILVPVFSFVLIVLYLSAGDVFFMRFGYEWLILFCLLLIIMNVYCLYFWYDVAANQELKHRLELMQQQSVLTHQYYEEMEKNYNESRKVIHDIRNHLHVLEQSEKMDEEAYFRDLHGMLNSLGLKFYSENRMLNIVLNDKLKYFPSDQVECNLGGISLDFMADVDITTVFSNLLDNAAEASEMSEMCKIPDASGAGKTAEIENADEALEIPQSMRKFWLIIRGEQIQDFTVIKISNYYAGSYQPGKSGKKGHEGIGLQNVKSAVEKYHGELKIECGESEFSVTMVFPGS